MEGFYRKCGGNDWPFGAESGVSHCGSGGKYGHGHSQCDGQCGGDHFVFLFFSGRAGTDSGILEKPSAFGMQTIFGEAEGGYTSSGWGIYSGSV